jgi:hypothetical protein
MIPCAFDKKPLDVARKTMTAARALAFVDGGEVARAACYKRQIGPAEIAV